MKNNTNDWHKKQEYPPQGLLVEGLVLAENIGKEWVVGSVCGKVVSEYGNDSRIFHSSKNFINYIVLSPINFRPIRSDREKAIDAACEIMGLATDHTRKMMGELYDAGLLRLPD